MFVYLPSLHPELAPPAARGAVRFFDPGLGSGQDPALFRPTDLPLDPAALAAFSTEYERLGREVRDPGELAGLRQAGTRGFFTETSFSVRDEMADRLDPSRVLARARRAAQATLCLAWRLEENRLDLARLEAAVSDKLSAFDRGLGFGEDDEEFSRLALTRAGVAGTVREAATDGLSAHEDLVAPWTTILAAMTVLLPPDCGFFTDHQGILETWEQIGVPFAAMTPGSVPGLPPEAGKMATVPVFRLLDRRRLPPEAPWLGIERTVAAPA